jgi:hypothetical protein
MALDPPWRLDPRESIVGVGWGSGWYVLVKIRVSSADLEFAARATVTPLRDNSVVFHREDTLQESSSASRSVPIVYLAAQAIPIPDIVRSYLIPCFGYHTYFEIGDYESTGYASVEEAYADMPGDNRMATTFYQRHPSAVYTGIDYSFAAEPGFEGLATGSLVPEIAAAFAAALSAQVGAAWVSGPAPFSINGQTGCADSIGDPPLSSWYANWVAGAITTTGTITTTTYENITVLKIPKSSDAAAFTIELIGASSWQASVEVFKFSGHELDPNNKATNGRVYDPVVPSDDCVQSVTLEGYDASYSGVMKTPVPPSQVPLSITQTSGGGGASE